MAQVVFLLQDNGFDVFIPAGAAQVSELADMDPPGPPLTQMVVHLR